MPVDIVMPRLSDTMEEGTILRWLKKPGEPVKKGEALAEVETDKANMELEAFEEGTMGEILVAEGMSAPVGRPVARLVKAGESPEKPQETQPAEAVSQQPPSQPKQPAEPGETVESRGALALEHEAVSDAITEEEKAGAGKKPTVSQPPQAVQAPVEQKGRVAASPLARRLAEAYGIDLSRVKGSGPEGRIMERDLEPLLQEQRQKRPAPPAQIPVEAPGPQEEKIEPLSRMRQTIAQRMSQSKQEVPHFYVTMAINGKALVSMQRQMEDDLRIRVTYTHILVKACARALVEHPRMNASYDEDGIHYHSDINIAVAVALPDGLITPVLHHADRLTLHEIAEQSHALLERTRNDSLRPEDLSGATFTLSNMGMYGVEDFVAIINPPQAAVLAVGALKEVPMVENGQVVPGYEMKLTLSADHRVVNGAEATTFLKTVCHYLEVPVMMMA